MTIQGARDELINMMECKDIPFYFVPILQKVVETIEMEIATVCDIEQIRAEIEELDRYYDNDYFSVNNCPMFKCNEVMQIIDKYK